MTLKYIYNSKGNLSTKKFNNSVFKDFDNIELTPRKVNSKKLCKSPDLKERLTLYNKPTNISTQNTASSQTSTSSQSTSSKASQKNISNAIGVEDPSYTYSYSLDANAADLWAEDVEDSLDNAYRECPIFPRGPEGAALNNIFQSCTNGVSVEIVYDYIDDVQPVIFTFMITRKTLVEKLMEEVDPNWSTRQSSSSKSFYEQAAEALEKYREIFYRCVAGGQVTPAKPENIEYDVQIMCESGHGGWVILRIMIRSDLLIGTPNANKYLTIDKISTVDEDDDLEESNKLRERLQIHNKLNTNSSTNVSNNTPRNFTNSGQYKLVDNIAWKADLNEAIAKRYGDLDSIDAFPLAAFYVTNITLDNTNVIFQLCSYTYNNISHIMKNKKWFEKIRDAGGGISDCPECQKELIDLTRNSLIPGLLPIIYEKFTVSTNWANTWKCVASIWANQFRLFLSIPVSTLLNEPCGKTRFVSLNTNNNNSKYTIGSNKIVSPNEPRYRYLLMLAKELQQRIPQVNDCGELHDANYQVNDCYEDYGSEMKWTNVLCLDLKTAEVTQVLLPKQWIELMNFDTRSEAKVWIDQFIDDKIKLDNSLTEGVTLEEDFLEEDITPIEISSYTKAQELANEYNYPIIYGYSRKGKFIELPEFIEVPNEPANAEKAFRRTHRNCEIIYVACPEN